MTLLAMAAVECVDELCSVWVPRLARKRSCATVVVVVVVVMMVLLLLQGKSR